MAHGITQYYLPPGRDDIPFLTNTVAGGSASCAARVLQFPHGTLKR